MLKIPGNKQLQKKYCSAKVVRARSDQLLHAQVTQVNMFGFAGSPKPTMLLPAVESTVKLAFAKRPDSSMSDWINKESEASDPIA